MLIQLGWLEVVLIVAVIMIILGPGRLPGLTKNMGQAMHSFWASFKGNE